MYCCPFLVNLYYSLYRPSSTRVLRTLSVVPIRFLILDCLAFIMLFRISWTESSYFPWCAKLNAHISSWEMSLIKRLHPIFLAYWKDLTVLCIESNKAIGTSGRYNLLRLSQKLKYTENTQNILHNIFNVFSDTWSDKNRCLKTFTSNMLTK